LTSRAISIVLDGSILTSHPGCVRDIDLPCNKHCASKSISIRQRCQGNLDACRKYLES